MKKINSLKDILEQYDYFFIDLNGILWSFDKNEFEKTNKMCIFDYSFNTIKFLYENNKTIIFFSNLRQTSEHTRNLLIKSGLKEEWVKNIVTSTQSLLDYIDENKFGNKYNYIAPESNFTLINDCYINIGNSNDYDFTITRGFEVDDGNKNLYIEKLNSAISSGKPILFLNPDRDKKELEVFGFSDICPKNCKNVVCFGKPYEEIYKYAFKKYKIKNKRRVLAVGDKLITDVLGAYNAGIDCVFIINGKIKEKICINNTDETYNRVLTICKEENLPIPNYILDNLCC